MNVRDIIIQKLEELGADGLYRADNYFTGEACGCEINSLAPCEECFLECEPARYNAKEDAFYPLDRKPEEKA